MVRGAFYSQTPLQHRHGDVHDKDDTYSGIFRASTRASRAEIWGLFDDDDDIGENEDDHTLQVELRPLRGSAATVRAGECALIFEPQSKGDVGWAERGDFSTGAALSQCEGMIARSLLS